MEITQLHYFKTVAKHESFTRAAEELHITQSALSRSIAQLEEDVGFSLFSRKKGGKITINPDGQFFLTQVTAILNTLENTVSAIQERSGLEHGVISVAQSETVFLKTVVLDFLCEHPQVRISCRLQSPEQMKESLEDGSIQFAVCNEPIAGPDLRWEPLFSDRLTVVMRGDNPLAKKKSLKLANLKNERFIISNIGYDMETSFRRVAHLAGFEPYIIYEGLGEDLSAQLVNAGLGLMIAPLSITKTLQEREIGDPEGEQMAIIPLSDSYAESEIGIVTNTRLFLTDAAVGFKEKVEEFYQNL